MSIDIEWGEVTERKRINNKEENIGRERKANNKNLLRCHTYEPESESESESERYFFINTLSVWFKI